MTIVTVGHAADYYAGVSGVHIATYRLETDETDPFEEFEGVSVAGLFAVREGAIEAVEELCRRREVLSEWIFERNPRDCAECGEEASVAELAAGYPLCESCSTFRTRRRYE